MGLASISLFAFLLQASAPALALQEDMCIPDASTPEAIFGTRSNDIAVAGNGEIFVAPDAGQHILRFSRSGDLLQVIGRAGEGPGEFLLPFRIGFLGDSLWAYDPRLARVSLFDPGGDFVRLLAAPDLVRRLGTRFVSYGVLEDGRLAGAPTLRMGRQGGSGLVPILAIHPEASGPAPHADTLSHVFEKDLRFLLTVPNGPSMITANEVDQSSVWMVDPRGTGVVIIEQPPAPGMDPREYNLVIIGVNGREVVRKTVPFDPVRLQGEVENGIYRRFAERLWGSMTNGGGVSLAAMEKAVQASMNLPAEHPPVTKLVGGYDGTIWVRRELPGRPPERWDVYSSTGEFVGVAHVPGNITLEKGNRDLVWGVSRDNLDVPSVCRYRVVLAESAPDASPGS